MSLLSKQLKKLLKKLGKRRRLAKESDPFLKESQGIIHVGANKGQERDIYRFNRLDIMWIEPIPEIFEQLTENIRKYPKQKAFQALITDKDDREYEFNISTNKGQSSSILDLKLHKEVWPMVDYDHTISLQGITLATWVRDENVDLDHFDALVMDTQGAELMVLKGAEPIIHKFKYIKAEVPDFEAYKDCCRLSDLEDFLIPKGFSECSRHVFGEWEEYGKYYDIIYKRNEPEDVNPPLFGRKPE